MASYFTPRSPNGKEAMQEAEEASRKREEEEANGGRCSRIHHWFMDFTSIGGLSQMVATDLAVSKVFWFVLFVIGVVMTVVSVAQVWNDFSSKPGACKQNSSSFSTVIRPDLALFNHDHN